jgi:hypothetical protein
MNINVAQSIGCKARYRIQTKNSLTGEWMQDTGWFDNLLTNHFLNMVSSSISGIPSMFSHCQLGFGSTPPTATDLTLQSPHGTRTSTVDTPVYGNSGAPDYYSFHRRRFVFAQGAVVGNMAEVGIFNGASGSNCLSRALLKDVGGTPTTITVTAIEQVYITWEIRMYPVLTDFVGSVTISGTSYPYKLRSFGVNQAGYFEHAFAAFHNGAMIQTLETNTVQSLTWNPPLALMGGYPSSVSMLTYVNGTFYSQLQCTWGPTAGNFATGIGTIMVRPEYTYGDVPGFGIYFTTKIPKDNTKQLVLTFRVTYSVI